MKRITKFATTKAVSALTNQIARGRGDLSYRRDTLLASQPDLRGRALAERLGICEAQLLFIDQGRSARLLEPAWPAILERVSSLGTVMAFTRNECAIHGKIGRYGEVTSENGIALVVGEEINCGCSSTDGGLALLTARGFCGVSNFSIALVMRFTRFTYLMIQR